MILCARILEYNVKKGYFLSNINKYIFKLINKLIIINKLMIINN